MRLKSTPLSLQHSFHTCPAQLLTPPNKSRFPHLTSRSIPSFTIFTRCPLCSQECKSWKEPRDFSSLTSPFAEKEREGEQFREPATVTWLGHVLRGGLLNEMGEMGAGKGLELEPQTSRPLCSSPFPSAASSQTHAE